MDGTDIAGGPHISSQTGAKLAYKLISYSAIERTKMETDQLITES